MGKWKEYLKDMAIEDPTLYRATIEIISKGCNIQRSNKAPTPTFNNLPTSEEDKILITDFLFIVLEKGSALGPFTKEELPIKYLHTSPLGCVDKPSLPGEPRKIRPIVHMSAPRDGISINSEILEEYRTVQYTSFRRLCKLVLDVGKEGFLWCVDAQDAYLRVPVRKEDWKWHGVRWFGKYIIITSLFFGLSSAPKLYTMFADAILWAITHHEKELFRERSRKVIEHYLDDFFGGAKHFEKANMQFKMVMHWFELLDVPTKLAKCKEPKQRQIILGFLFDTIEQKVRIPPEKVARLHKEMQWLLEQKTATKRQLLSIVGKLRWMAQAVYCLQGFVRGLEEKAHSVKYLHFNLAITREMKRDLKLCLGAVQSGANGFPLKWILKPRIKGDVEICTDASTLHGIGGFTSNGQYFQFNWKELKTMGFEVTDSMDIFWMEMFAILIAILLFGDRFRGLAIKLHCDNQACVESWKKKKVTFGRPDVMKLIRLLCGQLIKLRTHLWIEWIPGKKNAIADGLSRFDGNALQLQQIEVPPPKKWRNTHTPCTSLVETVMQKLSA